jgi:ATP-binding cassette subfamily C protein
MLQVYDRVVPTRGVFTLLFLSLIFAFAVATLSGLDFVRSRLLVRASLRLDRLLAPLILKALIGRVDAARSSQALREFDTLRSTLTGAGVIALFDAPWSPIYVIVCFFIHPALGALALFGSGVLLIIAFFNERAIKAPVQQASDASARTYQLIDQSTSAGGVVRALGMADALVLRHLRDRQSASHLQAVANYASGGFLVATKFTRLLLQSLALGLGAFLAIEQKISPGAIFAASLLVTRAMGPVELIVGAWRNVVQSRAAWRSVSDLLAGAPPADSRTLLPAPVGHLIIENVSILSPRRDRVLVRDVTFTLQPGEVLGVVGHSGAGKSTLVRAIVGAVPIASGAIRFDGADARDWSAEQLTRYVGYAPQEATFFTGTVKENIARFRGELVEDSPALDDAVIQAAMACGAHDFILRLPAAYETQIGFGGVGLSAGQAQRVALARALFGKPRFVIMDEPNAHLDAMGEADLIETIGALKAEGVTMIIVAHRTGVMAAADKMMVLREGRIEAFGPREELFKQIAQRRPTNEPALAPQAASEQ